MSQNKSPPPDHLIPLSWLEKSGVTPDELSRWVDTGLAVKVIIHGGLEFVSFTTHKRPVKFVEVAKLIAEARAKSA